ncbi:MAG TPA: CRTAC1 family protein [Thermoanaerobaculia bacterium]|nr:CRTAC1 family protein [Thermoanaerobaculia bacterium]
MERADRLLVFFRKPDAWFNRLVRAASGLIPALLLGCGPAEGDRPQHLDSTDSEPPLFVDVAAESGLDFVHDNGATGEFYFPELAHAGAAFLDFDNDGWLDVYLVQSGPLPARPSTELNANRLYRNLGDGTFENVTATAGVGDRGYGTGVAVADYDRDGWVDLYVTNLGANTLYRNDGPGADGLITFTDVTAETGVGDPGYSTCAAFFDFDRDGDLDLYVCNYLEWSPRAERPCLGFNGRRGYCRPGEYPPQSDTLYRNDGAGADGRVTFTDVSRHAGMRAVKAAGLGVVTADFDGDGWVDVYVANDQMPNHLWINAGDGTFREEALHRGAAINDLGLPEAGMGVATEDWDDDGAWDLWVVNLSGETNTFYRNLGGGEFRILTDELRLGAVSQPYTGFGTGFFDYDNDGHFDLFIANGRVNVGDDMEFDYAEPNQLLRGLPGGPFEDVSARAGPALALLEVSRAAAFGDYDNDGDVDILVANNDGPVRLLRNEVGSRSHWLSVQLMGLTGNFDRDGLGSVITIEAAGRIRRRQVQPAYSYGASNDPRVHFGLGQVDRIDRLHVTWADGTTQVLEGVTADQLLRVECFGAEDGARRP